MWYELLADEHQLVLQKGICDGIEGRAIFNANGTRRYFLEKRWSGGEHILTTIMMNPSNAAHDETDDTVDQMIGVAKNQGCHAIYVVNTSSIINGSSSKLKDSQFSFEEKNWSFISHAMTYSNVVFLGWGVKGQKGILKQIKGNSNLVDVFEQAADKLHCYEVIKSTDKKFVRNPLYFTPHPRPQGQQEKYRNYPIRRIEDLELIQLLSRK